MRRRAAAAALLCLLLPACATSEADAELQERIFEARTRNAVVGAAVALLVALALRHLVRALSAGSRARRERRHATPWAPRAPRRPVRPWLVAAALVTEVLADLALCACGALVGWVLGPTPASDPTIEGQLLLLVVVVVALSVPVSITLAVTFVVQGLAARLPDVGAPTLVLLGLPHAFVVTAGVSALVGERPNALGWVGIALGAVGAGGFWAEAAGRVRERSRARRGLSAR